MKNHVPAVIVAGDDVLRVGGDAVIGRRTSRFLRTLNHRGFFTMLLAPEGSATPIEFDRRYRPLRRDLESSGAHFDDVLAVSESSGWSSDFLCEVFVRHRSSLERSFLISAQPAAIRAARATGLTTIYVGVPRSDTFAFAERPTEIAADLDVALAVILAANARPVER